MMRLLHLGLTTEMRVMIGVGVTLIALASFVVGMWLGGRAGSQPGIGPACVEIRLSSTRLMDEARQLKGETPQYRLKARTALYQVINNRGCFSPQDLATSQAALDELNNPQPTSSPR